MNEFSDDLRLDDSLRSSDWHVGLVGLANSIVDGSIGDYVLRAHLLVADLLSVDGFVDIVLSTSGLLAVRGVLAGGFTDRDLDDVVVVGARLLAERGFFKSYISDRGVSDCDLVLATSTGDVGLGSDGSLGLDNLVALLGLLGHGVGVGDIHSSVHDDFLLYNSSTACALHESGSTATNVTAITSVTATTNVAATSTITAATDVAATTTTTTATDPSSTAAIASTVAADAGTSKRSLENKKNTLVSCVVSIIVFDICIYF